jgi:hypothetical protein
MRQHGQGLPSSPGQRVSSTPSTRERARALGRSAWPHSIQDRTDEEMRAMAVAVADEVVAAGRG